MSLSGNRTVSCIHLVSDEFEHQNVKHKAPDTSILEEREQDKLEIIKEYDSKKCVSVLILAKPCSTCDVIQISQYIKNYSLYY